MSERLCAAMRSAHEKLCVAQTDVTERAHRDALGEALRTVERVGVFYCTQWSRYMEPSMEGAVPVPEPEGETP